MKKYNIKISGIEYSVSINNVENKNVNVTINGREYEAEIDEININPTNIAKPKVQLQQSVIQKDNHINKKTDITPTGYPLKSPLPGVIIELKVKEGDMIKNGQPLLILEAMKMENTIQAEKEGVIEKINVSQGDSILQGHLLLTII